MNHSKLDLPGRSYNMGREALIKYTEISDPIYYHLGDKP